MGSGPSHTSIQFPQSILKAGELNTLKRNTSSLAVVQGRDLSRVETRVLKKENYKLIRAEVKF